MPLTEQRRLPSLDSRGGSAGLSRMAVFEAMQRSGIGLRSAGSERVSEEVIDTKRQQASARSGEETSRALW
jgi:hypothetical protein